MTDQPSTIHLLIVHRRDPPHYHLIRFHMFHLKI